MKYGLVGGSALLAWALSATTLMAAGPYIHLEAGVVSRDVVEEGPEIVGFTFQGDAVSTRLMAKVGIELWEVLNLYVQGGGADLSISEFNDYDSDLGRAYGGGVRLNLHQSPHRDRFTLFAELAGLRFVTDDKICISDCDTNPEIVKETIQWNEYTVLLGASGRFEGFKPYGGIRLSRVDGTDKIDRPDGTTIRFDLEEDDNFGIFGGVDIFLDRSEKTALNFEVSLIDQNSFRAAIRRSF